MKLITSALIIFALSQTATALPTQLKKATKDCDRAKTGLNALGDMAEVISDTYLPSWKENLNAKTKTLGGSLLKIGYVPGSDQTDLTTFRSQINLYGTSDPNNVLGKIPGAMGSVLTMYDNSGVQCGATIPANSSILMLPNGDIVIGTNAHALLKVTRTGNQNGVECSNTVTSVKFGGFTHPETNNTAIETSGILNPTVFNNNLRALQANPTIISKYDLVLLKIKSPKNPIEEANFGDLLQKYAIPISMNEAHQLVGQQGPLDNSILAISKGSFSSPTISFPGSGYPQLPHGNSEKIAHIHGTGVGTTANGTSGSIFLRLNESFDSNQNKYLIGMEAIAMHAGKMVDGVNNTALPFSSALISEAMGPQAMPASFSPLKPMY